MRQGTRRWLVVQVQRRVMVSQWKRTTSHYDNVSKTSSVYEESRTQHRKQAELDPEFKKVTILNESKRDSTKTSFSTAAGFEFIGDESHFRVACYPQISNTNCSCVQIRTLAEVFWTGLIVQKTVDLHVILEILHTFSPLVHTSSRTSIGSSFW